MFTTEVCTNVLDSYSDPACLSFQYDKPGVTEITLPAEIIHR